MQEKAAATATAVDEYNQAHRSKTLVEQHHERQKKVRHSIHDMLPFHAFHMLSNPTQSSPIVATLIPIIVLSRHAFLGRLAKDNTDRSLGLQEKRAKKKAKTEAAPAKQEEAQHPWRPFDRERDLRVPSAGGNPLDKLGDLSSRFGGSKTSRGFL